jgi:hypothetical protein
MARSAEAEARTVETPAIQRGLALLRFGGFWMIHPGCQIDLASSRMPAATGAGSLGAENQRVWEAKKADPADIDQGFSPYF